MFHLYAADRVEPLAEQLARVIRSAPVDPMTPEWIATPGAGMRTWLWLELARHLGSGAAGLDDGVAANLTAAFPGTLRSAVLAAGRPEDQPDPWAVERMVWTVLAVLLDGHDPDHPDDTDPVVTRFGSRRPGYAQARRIADLFDRYHVHRPELIRRWADGADADVTGTALASQHRWQPHVWRQVRERIGEPNPAEALPRLLAQVRSGELKLDLPHRLSLFGLPVLPGGGGFIDLASAVAERHDLHLFLLDPSPATTARVRAALTDQPVPSVRRRFDDATADLVEHPLLRSWGRLPRETAVLLSDARQVGVPEPTPVPSPEPPVDDPTRPPTLLRRLQTDLRAGRAPAGDHDLDPADRSVSLHAAYGRARQVDVARDAILHALADDPTLVEDDILVICPDLEAFAPLLAAGFGPSAKPEAPGPLRPGSATPALRYRIADRSLGRDNSVIVGLDALLDLLPGRFDAVVLQDLLALPAVRERYGFDDADLARIADWVSDANVRWGLDADHRVPFGVPATITTNSWGAAIDRLLLGATLPDDELTLTVGDIAPIGIEGDDVDLAGRLADVVYRLGELVDAIDDHRPLAGWLTLFANATDTFFAPPPDDDRQAEMVRRVFATVAEETGDDPSLDGVALSFADIRKLLRERLAAAPSRPPFFRGGITVTSPDSLRWVPFRVIILLGMDQAAFAPTVGDGDDLAAALPLVGDREPRADRRQAVLEAVLAAQDRLIVIREGRDLSTNRPVPAAVVVAELLDVIGATVAGGPAATADPDRLALEVAHPRQAFDERCFLPDALGSPAAWSFDPTARSSALARRNRTQLHLPFLADPLPPVERDVYELTELITAVSDPVRYFLSRRLQVQLPETDEGTPVQLPVSFGGLDRWSVGDRMVAAMRRGYDRDEWLEVERRRGSIPPGALGTGEVDQLAEAVDKLDEAAKRFQIGEEGPPVPIDLELPSGARIIGSVATSFLADPQGPARLRFGRLKPRLRLEGWLDLMALVATDPARSWRSVAATWAPGNSKKPGRLEEFDLQPVAVGTTERRDAAVAALELAVRIARQAHREPLPLFPETTWAVAAAAREDRRANRSEWRTPMGWGDGDRPHVALVYGDIEIDELYDAASRPEDPFDRPSRLEGWALHLWDTVDASVTDRSGIVEEDA